MPQSAPDVPRGRTDHAILQSEVVEFPAVGRKTEETGWIPSPEESPSPPQVFSSSLMDADLHEPRSHPAKPSDRNQDRKMTTTVGVIHFSHYEAPAFVNGTGRIPSRNSDFLPIALGA